MVDIVDRYKERICELYTQTHPNANPDRVRQLVDELTEKEFRDIPCVMHNNITDEKLETSITSVFSWIRDRNPIISGNGTFFKQHAEYLSPIVKMLETLQANRKRVKKEMYTYDKNSIEYVNRNTTQGSIKVIMNADYGGSGTPQSPFYSVYIPPATTQSARNITTTLICCLEFASGNQHPWAKLNSINELFDMIYIVLTNTEPRMLIDDFYTVDEVTEYLVSRTNNVSLDDYNLIKSFISTLTDSQRTALMLAFNIKLVLTRYLSSEVKEVATYIKMHPVQLDKLTKECIKSNKEEVTEMIRVAGYGADIPPQIVEPLNVISKTLLDNCIYPFIPNDCESRADNMKRIIVCVTDTDSLMVHFSHYIDELQARVENFRDSCLNATAIGMRPFIENIIPKFVEYIAMGANINDKYYRDKFVFKNEFAFLAMTLFAKKMYAASMFVQEGNPRDIHDIAVTGLSFKKRDAAEFLEPIMVRLYDQYVLTTDKISVEGLADEYYALRQKLLREVKNDASYYKVLSVKSKEAYEKTLPAQMRGMIIWNNLMPDEEILPMDRVIVVPLSTKAMFENSSNPRVAKIIELCQIEDPKMKKDHYISLPEYYHEIPEWIQPIVDIEVLIDKLLAPFKQLLGLFDFVMADTKGGQIPARMLYL